MNNRANKTSFQKGHGRLRTDESYKKAGIKISLSKTGVKRESPSKETRIKLSAAMKDRKITWGDKISFVKAFEGNSRQPTRIRYINRLEKKAGRPRPDRCEVCNRTGKIYFDHCHKSGKFRGWLCVKCNNTLGAVNDDPVILKALIKYVNKHSS